MRLIGGIATYPASVLSNQPLRWTLQTASHEWFHNYLAFRPLGRRVFTSPEMQTLNETLADLAGREIGDMAFQLLGGVVDPPPSPQAEAPAEVTEDEAAFDFAREMRETRLRVDDLLAEAAVEEA